jgi:hypothetical protein
MACRNRGKRIKQRRKMWESDPTCDWCGVFTILPENITPETRPRMATIEHLVGKAISGKDRTFNRNNHMLACLKCNRKRGLFQYKAKILWRKAIQRLQRNNWL